MVALGDWGPKRLICRMIKGSILIDRLRFSLVGSVPRLLTQLGGRFVIPVEREAFFGKKIVHHCLPVGLYYEYKIIFMSFYIFMKGSKKIN